MLHVYVPPEEALPLQVVVELDVPPSDVLFEDAVTEYVSPLFKVIGAVYAKEAPLLIET